MSAADAAFELQVSGWVQHAVQEGITTFTNLLAVLPGVDPAFLLHILRQLRSDRSGDVFQHLLDESKSAPESHAPRGYTVVPHPLDFDWRFTEACAFALVERLFLDASLSRFALLSTPSLVSPIHSLRPDSSAVLFDKNTLWQPQMEGLHGAIEFVACDLTVDSPQISLSREFDAVVADPPWYLEHQSSYLWMAAQLAHRGAMIAMTTPPSGTRPGIAEERIQIQLLAKDAGLEFIELTEGAVRYRSSPFETNAMRASGIFAALDEWRHGDLFIFRSERASHAPRPPAPSSQEVWEEVVLHGVRIKIRICRDSPIDPNSSPELAPLVDNDVLPTVSRRHPLRSAADVWTSGNRVFKCLNPPALLHLCRSLRDNGCGDQSLRQAATQASSSAFERAKVQLLKILETEMREYLSS